MNKELEDMLCTYLGELLSESENTFDWIEKDKITEKINAVNVLLEQPVRMVTWYEKVSEQLINFDKIKKN